MSGDDDDNILNWIPGKLSMSLLDVFSKNFCFGTIFSLQADYASLNSSPWTPQDLEAEHLGKGFFAMFEVFEL